MCLHKRRVPLFPVPSFLGPRTCLVFVLSPRISPASSTLRLPLVFPSSSNAIPHTHATPRCQQRQQKHQRASPSTIGITFNWPLVAWVGSGLFDAWRPALFCSAFGALLLFCFVHTFCGGRSRGRNPRSRNSETPTTKEPKNQKLLYQRTPALDVLSSALGYVTNPAPPLQPFFFLSTASPSITSSVSLLSILSTLIPPAIPNHCLLCPLCSALLHTLFFSFFSLFSFPRFLLFVFSVFLLYKTRQTSHPHPIPPPPSHLFRFTNTNILNNPSTSST